MQREPDGSAQGTELNSECMKAAEEREPAELSRGPEAGS